MCAQGHVIIPIWLLGSLFAINILPDNPLAALAVSLAWIIPIGILRIGPIFILPPVFEWSEGRFWLLLIFLFSSLATCFKSPDQALSLGYWTATVTSIIACGSLWRFAPDIKPALERYAIIASLAIAVIGVVGFSGGRFGVFRNPNSVGLILLATYTIGLLIRDRWKKALVVGVSGFILVMTGSRSAFLGAVIASAITVAHFSHVAVRKKRLLGVVTACLIVFLIAWYGQPYFEAFVVDQLALDDRHRGLASGFTGRVHVWRETLVLWEQHPLTGVGYRAHQVYLHSGSSAHNGYLALLAEVGLLGAIPLFVLFGYGYWRLMVSARRGDRGAVLGLAITSGYLFVSCFESYFLNFGNPTSLIVLAFMFAPFRQKPFTRHCETGWSSAPRVFQITKSRSGSQAAGVGNPSI